MKNKKLFTVGDYTVITREREDGSIYEFVVAWLYHEDIDEWQQGHYFKTFTSALEWIINRYKDDQEVKEKLENLLRCAWDLKID